MRLTQYCTAKWISHMYTHTPFFWNFRPSWVTCFSVYHQDRCMSNTALIPLWNQLQNGRWLCKLTVFQHGVSLIAQLVENLAAMQETLVWFLGWEDSLEKGKVTHSSILAWRIPWTIQSTGSQRVRHDWATFTFTFTLTLSFLYSPTLTFIHDYWKNHSFD